LPFFKVNSNFVIQSLLNRCDFIQKRGEIGLTEPLATMNDLTCNGAKSRQFILEL